MHHDMHDMRRRVRPRRAADRVRVSIRLTDADRGILLWSEKFDERLKDVFAFQEAITRRVAETLASNVTRVEEQRALAKPPGNLDAYDLVLRGRATPPAGTTTPYDFLRARRCAIRTSSSSRWCWQRRMVSSAAWLTRSGWPRRSGIDYRCSIHRLSVPDSGTGRTTTISSKGCVRPG
jgi:hypothetical protein